MAVEFSARTRSASLARMRTEGFDVLVIGGGIVGAAVARDAATRGLRTALVERGDFGSGTSGKTSRLIHGGLRYLKDMRIRLVRQAIRERDRLLRLAPAMVQPLRFVIPAYEGGLGMRSLRLGLFLYDLLSREKSLPRHRWLSPEEVLQEEPRLRRDGLQGGGVYYDAWSDDARLVLAVIRDAAAAGATVANHAEVVEILREAGRAAGGRVRDNIGGDVFGVRASVVVNATGVWMDRLRPPDRPPAIRPTKGTHILLPRERVGNREALTLTAPRDGRIVFVLPCGPLALIGTTDTDYDGDPDRVTPEEADVAYLLESVNEAFLAARVGADDVVSAYAGLRPLVGGRRKGKESDISREHDIFTDSDGLISIAGGKLTTQRAMAEEVVGLVCRRLGLRARCVTADRPLGPPREAKEAFRAMGFAAATADHLARRHDPSDIRPSLDEADARERIEPGLPYLWVEVHTAVLREMAMALDDVLVRRVPLFLEASDQGRSVAPTVATRIAPPLGWDADRIRQEVHAYERLIEDHRRFRTNPTDGS